MMMMLIMMTTTITMTTMVMMLLIVTKSRVCPEHQSIDHCYTTQPSIIAIPKRLIIANNSTDKQGLYYCLCLKYRVCASY